MENNFFFTLVGLIVLISLRLVQCGNPLSLCDASDESPEECDIEDPLYLLHNDPNNPESYHQLFMNKASIELAQPHKDAVWKVLIHGFINNRNSLFPVNVRNAYLERTNRTGVKYNVLVVDWGRGACASLTNAKRYLYDYAAHNVAHIGKRLGDFLEFMHNNNYLNLTTNVHLVGFSLGAHVAGRAGMRVFDKLGNDGRVKRISGLDPAGPAFWAWKGVPSMFIPNPRLQRAATQFADIYHTSERFGSNRKMGDVDFVINGGISQPGCVGQTLKFFVQDLVQVCSHNAATSYFAKSINDNSVKGCWCPSYKSYTTGSCDCSTYVTFGEFVDNFATGEYYVTPPQDSFTVTGFIKSWMGSGFKDMLKAWWEILC